jgi:hypothetical protein
VRFEPAAGVFIATRSVDGAPPGASDAWELFVADGTSAPPAPVACPDATLRVLPRTCIDAEQAGTAADERSAYAACSDRQMRLCRVEEYTAAMLCAPEGAPDCLAGEAAFARVWCEYALHSGEPTGTFAEPSSNLVVLGEYVTQPDREGFIPGSENPACADETHFRCCLDL